ncbi:flagellar operon protein [Cytobacillus eiseniae]|uniref:Flagellar operon protein n=1 Tax=Cytobacillus eiseniae TaxID=762947 RepID=A0ABS4RB49_9BACI|nr:TIGR02530 family flagellar biosynthesis protein [Cytobacillus eiseniae]MBP2240132.1 flagellar operon protein [Cytobacillus eiseniae]
MDKMMFHPIQPKSVTKPKPTSVNQTFQSNNQFTVHFHQALQTDSKLTVSKHAKERLLQRGIHINETSWNQIEKKVQEAKNKGVKESLVLLKDAALIVSAKNNTVITAMDREEARTQIFTNINGTILLDQ